VFAIASNFDFATPRGLAIVTTVLLAFGHGAVTGFMCTSTDFHVCHFALPRFFFCFTKSYFSHRGGQEARIELINIGATIPSIVDERR